MAARYFVMRHGAREDQKNPRWVEDALRPGDSPLTEDGKAMGQAFGSWLLKERIKPTSAKSERQTPTGTNNNSESDIRLEDIVIISSPMTRCVETCSGIVEGLGQRVPIYIENSLVEGLDWIYKDLSRRPEFAARPMAMKPLWLSAAELHADVSDLVDPSYKSCHSPTPELNGSGGLTEASSEERSTEGCLRLMKLPQLRGKTVILVCHGGTSWFWYCALSGFVRTSWYCPRCTAFCEVEHKSFQPATNTASQTREESPTGSQPSISTPAVTTTKAEYITRGEHWGVPHLEHNKQLLALSGSVV